MPSTSTSAATSLHDPENALRDQVNLITATAPRTKLLRILADHHLEVARSELREQLLTPSSHRAELPSLSAEARTEYFRSDAFKNWVNAEAALGNKVLWVTDLDRAMAAGDAFVHFFEWRAREKNFTNEQNAPLIEALSHPSISSLSEMEPKDWLDSVRCDSPHGNARAVLEVWERHEKGEKDGLSLRTFWHDIYWPSLAGLTREEKQELTTAFAKEYSPKIFPGVRDANTALREAGVEVVIISNGDEELAKALAPYLGIDSRSVAGAQAQYDEDGKSTGKAHFFELTSEEWKERPDPGKFLRFGCWASSEQTEARGIEGKQIIIAGFDGDSARPDGGAMLFMRPKLGFFGVDTPGEHDQHRIVNFKAFMEKYGHWLAENFIALTYPEPEHGPFPKR